jgi:environmental stress-induced protein Ves
LVAASTPEQFAIAALAPQPWKNGAGLTREIAVGPRGADNASFDWRISLAEVARDAPFSAFPGIDRCITLLRGAGMRLVSLDRSIDHRLDQVLAPFCFAGELALNATLFDGACSDFNVMTRRGAWSAEVSVVRAACELADADVMLLLGVSGSWQIDAGATDHDAAWCLEPDAALLWRTRCGTLWVTPTPTPTLTPTRPQDHALLQVRLCQDRG